MGPEIDDVEPGSALPLGIVIEVAGRKMQEDFGVPIVDLFYEGGITRMLEFISETAQYGDYVSGRIWALLYDPKAKRVTANRTIRDKSIPMLSFGEDEQGESFVTTPSAGGKGIYRIVK